LPSLNRFYIRSLSTSENVPWRYYGPFEGDPFTVLGGRAHREAANVPRAAGVSLANLSPGNLDNPLGLDDETIIQLFQTAKRLQSVAMMTSQWVESHHLRVPSSLDEVYVHYLNRDDLMKDPFGEGKLRVEEFDSTIRIYSVGP